MQREAAHIPAFECVGGANHQLRFPFFPFGAVGAIDTQSEVNTSCVESLPGYFVGRDPFPSPFPFPFLQRTGSRASYF